MIFCPPPTHSLVIKKNYNFCRSQVTHISIPSTRLMSDHVLYQVHMSNMRKRQSFSRWTVLKRYGQFYNLDSVSGRIL